MPKDVMDEINASMPPDLCAPAAAFLAHESCPLNGEVLQIGMGGVARIAVVRVTGDVEVAADRRGHRAKTSTKSWISPMPT